MKEDLMRINEQTRREIAKAREEIKQGKTHTLEEVKERLKIVETQTERV